MTASTMKTPACLAVALIAAVAVFAVASFAEGEESATEESVARPVELGAVDWGRDFDAAIREERKTCKPLLVLFQEVPG